MADSPHFSVPGADTGPFALDLEEAEHHAEVQLHLSDDAAVEVSAVVADIQHGAEPEDGIKSHGERPFHFSYFNIVKHVCSLCLTFFSIAVVAAAIFTKQTTATAEKNIHPVFAFVVFWALLLWLAQLEGGLNCMVGLKPIDSSLYEASHKKTFGCTKLAHKGDNLERFIVGRQYLDLMMVFITSFMVSTVDGAAVLGLPKIVNDIFLASGLAVILVTIIFGQLIAQINAAHSMLDFMNNYLMLFSTYVALAVEGSGLLHAVYLVQIFFSILSGKPIESDEPAKTIAQQFLFWARVAMSCGILGFSFAVAFSALFDGNTTMWDGVPPVVSLIIFISLIGLVGIMEGLQIALFAVVHHTSEELERHPRAKRNCEIIFSGHNLQSFLVGRQICQTVIMFAIARITTVEMKDGSGNLFGVSDAIQAFFDTGVLGALLSTIVASLSWRIVASSFPMVFLANPISIIIIRLCLAIEGTGICYSAWFFAYFHNRLCGFQNDDVFVGTIEERQEHATKLDQETTMSGSSPSQEDVTYSVESTSSEHV